MTRRRQWFVWAVVAYAIIIAVVWFSLANLYRASYDRLDEALGQRLLAVAATLAHDIDGRLVVAATHDPGKSTIEFSFLESDFKKLRIDQALSEISLTSLDGIVLVAGSPSLEVGMPNDFLGLDTSDVDAALAGSSTITPLYNVAGNLQKSAHVPVYDSDPDFDIYEVVGVLTVSGNADFFDTLEQLKRGAMITGAVVLFALVLMGVFLYRINLSFAHYQDSIQRQENLAAMGRMTAGIAHEIRNPLGIIRGAGEHMQMVLNKAGIEDPVADFIPEEVDRLNHILNGYLAFGSNREPIMESMDLVQCLHRGARLFKDEMDRAGISINLPDVADIFMIQGDPLRLQQVVLNLLINARDAMAEGGIIDVELTKENNRAVVRVKDEGIGLSAVDADRLFEPFWTNKEKGSGLGLAMSRRVVEEMNGKLNLSQRQGHSGAVAEFSFPLLGNNS